MKVNPLLNLKIRVIFLILLFRIIPCVYGDELFNGVVKNCIRVVQMLNPELKLDYSSFTPQGQDMSLSDLLDSPQQLAFQITKLIKSKGVFMRCFRVEKSKFKYVPLPFFAYLDKKGYYLVTRITDQNITTYNAKGEQELLTLTSFLRSWNGYIVSCPIMNLWVEDGFSLDKTQAPVFYIIYSSHKEEFSHVKLAFTKVLKEATQKGKKVIYLDELGLIPKRSIEQISSREKISEQEAFSKVKKELQRELSYISQGIPLYDSSPLYRELYRYLAKYKVEAVMEDLNYELWRKIVQFDEENIYQEVIRALISKNIDEVFNKVALYEVGFDNINIYIRDVMFSYQILKLANEKPDYILCTLRGLGHYGMEEYTNLYKAFRVKMIAIGNGGFKNNYIKRSYVYLLTLNGVIFPQEEKKRLFLLSPVQESLRFYLVNKGYNFGEAMVVSNKVTDEMDSTLFNGYLDYLFRRIWVLPALKKKKVGKDIKRLPELTYSWMKDKGLINIKDADTGNN